MQHDLFKIAEEFAGLGFEPGDISSSELHPSPEKMFLELQLLRNRVDRLEQWTRTLTQNEKPPDEGNANV